MEDFLAGETLYPSSTCVEEARYDPEAHEMHIRFVRGTKFYSYPCSEESARAFWRAESKGRYVAGGF